MGEDYGLYMNRAIELAKTAGSMGEVPIGAVVVCDGEIVGEGYNQRETGKNALNHAELIAIRQACKTLGGWRLHRCSLYVTLEPCPMCAGAIINSRIHTLVYGARDPKAGSAESVVNLFSLPYNHRPTVIGGIREEVCASLLSDFFAQLRLKKGGAGNKPVRK